MRKTFYQTGIVITLATILLSTPSYADKIVVTHTIKIATHSPVTKVSDHVNKTTGQAKRSVSEKSKKQGVGTPKSSTAVHNISPSPVYAPLPDFKKDVARKIKNAFPDDARTMIAIAMAESGLNCGAVNAMDSNGVQAVGLFQINDGRWFSDQDIANLSDCDHNIERAKTKYRNGGFTPWGVWHSGSYKKYLWIFDEI